MAEIALYTPRPGQRALHELIAQHRFVVAVCHRQFGKTTTALVEAIMAALTTPRPHPRVIYCGPFRNWVKTVAWDALKRLLAPLPDTEFNEADLRVFQRDAIGAAAWSITLAGADNPDALRGGANDFVVLDEASRIDERVFSEILRPTLAARQGRMLFISTPNGRNWFHDLWQRAEADPEWGRVMFTASASGVLPASELESNRRTLTEEQFNQEFECAWTAATGAAIYGALMDQAHRDNRITHVPHRPGYDVITAWDLGYRDACAIWFIQHIGPAYHAIDFYQASGLAITDYADVLKERKRLCGYSYPINGHLAPHDAGAASIQSGRSLADVARDAGLDFTIVERTSVASGIALVRQLLPQCWFDEGKCAEGIEALEKYGYAWNPEMGAFSLKPEHSRWSHPADALRTFATGHEGILDEDDLEKYTKNLRTDLTFNPFTYDKQQPGLEFNPWR